MANPHPAKPFVKGDSRINRKGRSKSGESLAEKFRDALNERLNGDYTKLDSAIDAAINKALKGDLQAIEFVLARGWGKLIDRVQNNNINKNYDFSNLSMQDRMKLLELIQSVNPIVPDNNPDSL